MKQLYISIKEYIKTIYRLFKHKRNVVLYIKKDNTFGLTYFNMTEEQTRHYLFLSFEHFASNQIIKNEIEEMTK